MIALAALIGVLTAAAMVDGPRSPRNTERAMRDDPAEPLLFVAEAMGGGGSAAAIENMEAAGQRELLGSEVIPTRVLHSTEDDLTAAGFGLGDPVQGDPLFRRAALPKSWKREGSEHAMWSFIVDDLGRRRCSIFYKAAFYDRDAHISLTTVSGYVAQCVADGTLPVLDEEWATRDSVMVAIDGQCSHHEEQAAFWSQRGQPEYSRHHEEKIRRLGVMKAAIADD